MFVISWRNDIAVALPLESTYIVLSFGGSAIVVDVLGVERKRMDVASTLFEERVEVFSHGPQFVKKIPWKTMKYRRPCPAKQARTKPVDDTPLYLLLRSI